MLEESETSESPNPKQDSQYKNEDNKYFQTLNLEKQQEILNIESQISKINTNVIPLRFSILESNLDINNKGYCYQKNRQLFLGWIQIP